MEFYRNDKVIPVDVYADDTIEMVYYKLSLSLKCSIDDIYLFSSRHYDTFTTEQQYEKLVMNEYSGIPAFHLRNFYQGVNKHIRDVKGDQVYHEEDLEDLHDVWIEFPIGQRVKSAADPRKALDLDSYTESETERSTLQRLLLDYMPFKNIYVCCKEDYKGRDGYFNHEALDADAMQRINTQMLKLVTLSDKYTPRAQGITRVVCRVDPVRPMVIPLDILFNYLHVSEDTPMIQYNTGNEDNIMYKLLTNQVDLKGDKIPVVDEKTVVKHDKSYKKSVTVFIPKKKGDIKYGFMGDGSVMMEINCPPSTIEEIDKAFLVYKNLFTTVGSLMYKSGFVYPEFTSIREASIVSMDMYSAFRVEGSHRTCANPFFVGSGEDTRYRRVSRFNESALIDELCIEYYDRNMLDKIAPLIAQIMGISVTESRVIAEERIAALDGLRETNPNKRFVVKNRVGFVSIVKHKNDEIMMTITGITSIYYKESIQRNMQAYVAFQANTSIQCEEAVKVEVVKPFSYRYVDDSDTESEQEFDIKSESDQESDIKSESDQESDDRSTKRSDSESDEEFQIEESDDELEGGAGVDKNLDLIIKNESFLITRIKQTFNPSSEYAKQCPLNRRPVVFKPGENTPQINEKFKQNIQTHNGHTFVCTKYWDMKQKRPLNKGELGDQKVILPNKMENHEVDFEKDGTIVDVQDKKDYPFPGILKNARDAPCCFIKPQKTHPEKKQIAESKKYIVETTNSLNDPGQVGRLPKSIRYFFGLMIKDNHLLRYGIEKPHSFMQCIDTVFQKAFASKTKTLKSQLEVWIKRGFDTYNNGNLKRQFKTVDTFLQALPSMDYTYLWEIVCDLFNVNLVIFRDPHNDGDDLEVICPSNHYSTRSFDTTKKCLLILEHKVDKGYAFEPLVEHNIKTNTQIILHEFKNTHLHEGFQALVQIFWKCKTTTSSYTPSILASVMHGRLGRGVQVVRDGKCIGFSVENQFIPCYPSAIVPTIPLQDEIPINTYKSTVNRLKGFAKKEKIPCTPSFKVVENGMIVGIILETNAFVPCTPLPDYNTAGLPIYSSTIHYEYEPLHTGQDDDRIRNTRRNKAEKCLYAATRRILKEILGKDAKLRAKINKLIQQKKVTGKDVKTILEPRIQFVDKTDESFIQTQVKCGGCCYASDKLILPKKHLVTGEPNQYFSRLAEELNYYTRFSTFITSPQLSIPDVPFAINDNEFLLTSSTVRNYYASLMEAKRLPEYYTTFDNANPKHIPGKLGILKVKKMEMVTL